MLVDENLGKRHTIQSITDNVAEQQKQQQYWRSIDSARCCIVWELTVCTAAPGKREDVSMMLLTAVS